MAGTLAAGHPSRSEPRGAKLRRVVDRGRKGLARLDRLIESRPWFAPALIVVAGALVTGTSGPFRICVWRHHSSGLGQAFFRSVVGGKSVSAVAVGHELGLGEPDLLFLRSGFVLHHQFVFSGPSLPRIWLATSRTFRGAGVSGVGSGRVSLASAGIFASRRKYSRSTVHLVAVPLTHRSCGAICVCRVLGFRLDAVESLLCDPVAGRASTKHSRSGDYVCSAADDAPAHCLAVWVHPLPVRLLPCGGGQKLQAVSPGCGGHGAGICIGRDLPASGTYHTVQRFNRRYVSRRCVLREQLLVRNATQFRRGADLVSGLAGADDEADVCRGKHCCAPRLHRPVGSKAPGENFLVRDRCVFADDDAPAERSALAGDSISAKGSISVALPHPGMPGHTCADCLRHRCPSRGANAALPVDSVCSGDACHRA